MKKFTMISALVLAVVLIAGNVMATPIFYGDPVADFGTGASGLPTNPQGPGYYIWANDEARTSWSVRWTGKDWITEDYNNYNWSGNVSFSNPGGIVGYTAVLWEASDGSIDIHSDGIMQDYITFGPAVAGPQWDGFDFTLSGFSGDLLKFELGSTYFTLDNDGIYMGQDMVSVLDFADSSAGFKGATGRTRHFEVYAPVPEPGTVLLLGAGLLGLIGLGRKHIKK